MQRSLSNKPMESYSNARDFSISLGLVQNQNTTGVIRLGSITKQGESIRTYRADTG